MGASAIAVVLALPLAASSATHRWAALHSVEQAPAQTQRAQSTVALANGRLRDIVDRLAHGRRAPAGVTVRGDKVLVEIAVSGNAAEVRRTVADLGGDVTGSVGNVLVEGYVPYDQLVSLEASRGVRYVRPPLKANEPVAPVRASAAAAAIPGEEIVKTNAAAWHTAGFEGAGVKVAIVDFFDQGAWDAALASGDVPAPAGTFCRETGVDCSATMFASGDKHGVAVAEIVHEMAPDAQIYLATADTTADLQAAVNYFFAQGVDIVARPLTAQYDGPGNGTGPLAGVIADAVSKGMTWFNSAGNTAGSDAQPGSYWRGLWADADSDGWLDFAAGDEMLAFRCGFIYGFRWSDWGANRTDYDIFIYDSTMTLVWQGIANQSAGADPIEYAQCATPNATFYLAVHKASDGNGTATDTLEFMTNGTGLEYWQNPYSASSSGVDLNNAGALAVGAIEPWNGTTIAPYSSQGPTNDNRTKPELVAASCVSTLSFAPACFNGTSASTAVAAGAAALVQGAGLAGTPAQTRAWLLANATTDRGPVGPDNIYGAGELILPAPPSGEPPPSRNLAAAGSVDFDGDGKTDLGALYRPSSPGEALWFAMASGGGSPFQIFFGASADVPLPGDYDGDRKTDAVVYRPTTGLWYGATTGAAATAVQMPLGQPGDIPIPGDYDGDGKTDPAIWRPSTGLFFAMLSGGGVKSATLGAPTDVPVPRDYDGDGKTDFAIYRAAGKGEQGLWSAQLSGGGVYELHLGSPGDIPVPGDYNGDGRAEGAIFRPSTGLWYGPYNGAAGALQLILGGPGDVPIPGYYDSDLKLDPAYYRKASGLWFALDSGGGVSRVDALGLPTDVPVQKRPTLAGGL